MTRPPHRFPSPSALAAAGLAVALVLSARPLRAAPADRVLTAAIPAAALTHLDLTSLDGTVDLRADPNPAATVVTISVGVEPAKPRLGHRPPAAVALADVTLDWSANGNVLRVGLKHAAEGNVEAAWTITVPARFSARVAAHDGAVTIDGLAGGVEADVNAGLHGGHGRLTVDVPRGRLALAIGVGNIVATRRDASFSSAVVKATVGDATLFLLGHEIVAPREPGPGHRVSLDGSGPDTLSLKASVGDVSLKIG